MNNIAHIPLAIQVLIGLVAFYAALRVTKRDPLGYTVFVLATFVVAGFKPALLYVPATLAVCTVIMLLTLCTRRDSKA